jgi:hypothetical protein
MSIPKVFVSYSHDSPEHKKWVLELAIRMRNSGVDAILDQWELKAGDDLPHFMETQLASADSIVMVCTEKYVKKANSGEGGVGYEKMIITSNLMSKINENKIIPVIKQIVGHSVPTFLKTKLFINLSDSSEFEFGFDELIRTIHKSPLYKKPEIGNNPFKQVSNNYEIKSKDGIIELMREIANVYENISDAYVLYRYLLNNSKISRVYFDLLLDEAVSLGYILKDKDGDIWLQDKGREYIIENKLTNKYRS